jgi:hypothetical protein
MGIIRAALYHLAQLFKSGGVKFQKGYQSARLGVEGRKFPYKRK